MWFIQTSVDTLALPTDSEGRPTLTGSASAWQHLVRDSAFPSDERARISEMPINWTMWAWQQVGRRVQLHNTVAVHLELAEMVRTEPFRACVLVRFPQPGKRQADNVINVIIVLPPEQFARYEALVKFAMTLPAGLVAITMPAPVALAEQSDSALSDPAYVHTLHMVGPERTRDSVNGEDCRLVVPGTQALLEGLEMVVARSAPTLMSKADLRGERRGEPQIHAAAKLLQDNGDDWLLFRAGDHSLHK